MEEVVSGQFEGPGVPVEIGQIDRALGRLWEEAGDSKSRASLLNLVLYTEDRRQVDANTSLIAEIAGEHACRAILILAEPDSPKTQARAWISAHCHLANKREICSEQISFHLEGEAVAALTSIVFSHLDSDLPLCFWWQAPFREPTDEKLWVWVDRLLFDSACWPDPAEGIALTQRIGALEGGRTVLGDLNWARVLGARRALANLFDHPHALAMLKNLETVEIDFAPGHRSTALLLMGWLASRFRWRLQDLIDHMFFVDEAGHSISFVLTEVSGAPISRCAFTGKSSSVSLCRQQGREYFETRIEGCPPQLINSGRERFSDLILAELGRGGRHGQYRDAVAAIAPLFSSK